MKLTFKFVALVAAATTALVTRSFAVDYDFSNGDANNVWVDGNNWTPAGGPPTAADNARVGTTAFATETANLSGTDAGTANNVRIGLDTGTDGTVNMSNHSTLDAAGNVSVGDSGTGTLNMMDHSTFTVGGNMVIGNHVGSVGSLIMTNNAVLDMTAAMPILDVGRDGQGTLEIHGNAIVGSSVANEPTTLNIGRNAGSTGTVLVSGAGATLNVLDFINVGGTTAGPGGQGELRIVNGGTVNTFDMTVLGPGSGNRGTLSVDSSYVLNISVNGPGGTLTFVGGELNFVGDGVNFINDATLTNAPGPDQNGMFANVGAGNTATISGVLSGNGQLVKNGTGTLILNNIGNTFSGGTNINNGTLQVGAATPGVTLPGPYASVFGAGDVNLNNAATLQGTPGTATAYVINGNFNANGSAPDAATLVINLGGTPPETIGVSSDFIGVVGNANLTTGTGLFAHRLPGSFFADGSSIKFLETLGTSVNGTFFQQQGDLIPNDFGTLIQPFVSYDPGKEVDAVFGFAASFASVAKTPNQIATAEALDAAVAAGCIVNATNVLGNVPINTLRHAYDLIAPEELASMYEASFAQGMVQSLNLQHRMDDVRWGSTGFCADGFVIQDNHGYTKNDGKSVADKNPVEETPPPDYRWGSFITGTGELTKVGDEDANGDHHGYQLNNASFTMGAGLPGDRSLGHWFKWRLLSHHG